MRAITSSPHPSHRELILPRFDKSVRVRFGTTRPASPVDIEFNSIESINSCANKIRMKLLLMSGEVATPRLITLPCEHDLPVVFKRNKHSRGRGMELVTTMQRVLQLVGHGYFEAYKEATKEYRVHVLNGEAFHVDIKILRRDETEHHWIKNSRHGYRFVEPRRLPPSRIIDDSVKAVQALGLTFGAVDVARNDEEHWIYEVNSAPGLRTRTRRKYREAITNYIISQGANYIGE